MKRALETQAQDRLAVERWSNEGGRIVPTSATGRRRTRARVLIAGAGVAGLETLLALRALAADRVDITLLAPELKFVNRSMAVRQPFRVQRARGLRLERAAAELGAHWHRGELDRVQPDQHRVVTKRREVLAYDRLVLALGARPGREWQSERILTYHGQRDGPAYRLLLRQLQDGRIHKLAFVRPAGASWPLPLYDLALMTAARCAEDNRAEVELTLITPEEEPLGIFGKAASAAIRRILEESEVALQTSSHGVPRSPGRLEIYPGGRSIAVDRIVTEPRLVGPLLRGVPSGRDGFIQTDGHGRVPGLEDVWAAGDATTFPVKQGGIAAQQADAVAEAIAASAGAEIDPQPFRPVLRGTLLAGSATLYLRADISGRAGDDSLISSEALWWPPNKLCGRYLAPYLSSQLGEAADVMPQDADAIHVETPLDRVAADVQSIIAELSDLGPR